MKEKNAMLATKGLTETDNVRLRQDNQKLQRELAAVQEDLREMKVLERDFFLKVFDSYNDK